MALHPRGGSTPTNSPRLRPSTPQNPSHVSPSPCCPELARPAFTCSSASAIAQSESHMTYPEIRENSPCPQPTGKCSFPPNQSGSLSNSHYFSTEVLFKRIHVYIVNVRFYFVVGIRSIFIAVSIKGFLFQAWFTIKL